jgi:hypothetical protein
MVTVRRSLMRASQPAFPHQWDRAKPPWISGRSWFFGVKNASNSRLSSIFYRVGLPEIESALEEIVLDVV